MTRNEEILTILQEECAEVIQAVSKVRRFGLEGNVEELKKELCDLQCMINLAEEFGVITYTNGSRFDQIVAKREKLKKFSKIFEESKELRYDELNKHQKNSVEWFGSPNGA
jgi:NTP pyrophosphatase (non-canonical NTP hydrolase)